MLYELYLNRDTLYYIHIWKVHSSGLIWCFLFNCSDSDFGLESLCFSPPAPAWSQAALSHLLLLALHTCTVLPCPTALWDNPAMCPPGLQNPSWDSSKYQGLAKPHLNYISDLVSQMSLGSSTPVKRLHATP